MRISFATQLCYNCGEVIYMEKLPRYYLRLFNSVTDAVALILAEQEDPLGLDRSVKAIVETLQEGTVSAEDLERKIRAALAQVVE